MPTKVFSQDVDFIPDTSDNQIIEFFFVCSLFPFPKTLKFSSVKIFSSSIHCLPDKIFQPRMGRHFFAYKVQS